jgi:hypothetical protein
MENENEFRKHLKQMGKKPEVIDGLVKEVYHFEDWLLIYKGKALDGAIANDLQDYAKQLNMREIKIYMRALALVYRWLGNDELKELAHSMRETETTKSRKIFKLSEFRGGNPEEISKLETLGIRNVEDMLRAGETPLLRKELAKHSGVSPETILELVKLSDISRLEGVKGIRARLYVDAGIDSIEAFNQWEPKALRNYLDKFVHESGFEGIAPLPKEIESTIQHAAELPRVVEY